MKLKDTIKRILREESKVPIQVRRRLGDVDWSVEFQVKEVVKRYGSPCKLSLSDFIEVVTESVITSLYWNTFSYMDDDSNEWEVTYHFLVNYIENNFGDKLREYYHINCGD